MEFNEWNHTSRVTEEIPENIPHEKYLFYYFSETLSHRGAALLSR